jgi:protein-S-isoprenylcysteine O-methyltransferase Ste14
MPRLAFALALLWFLALFVVRTLIQWRRTGSTGLRGFHGRVGSLPWTAGASVSLGVVLALAAPLAAWLGWPGGSLLVSNAPVHGAGAALLVGGTLGALGAQLTMGDSWRVGVDESERTALVTTGLFARIRNPIFTFMGLSLLGLIGLVPNAASLLGGALALVGIELQVRFVEEPWLARTHGAHYRAYAARTGRFLPGIGRIDEQDLRESERVARG